MKLKDYIAGLNKLAKENPDALELEIVTSCDDEGNGFNAVHYPPSLGSLDDGYFISSCDPAKPTAVCVN